MMIGRTLVWPLVLLSFPAWAGDPLKIETPSELAAKCFALPKGAPNKAVSMVFDVSLDSMGMVVDISIRDGFRATRETAMAGARAIMACAPYPLMGEQVMEITAQPARKIDPLKGALPSPEFAE